MRWRAAREKRKLSGIRELERPDIGRQAEALVLSGAFTVDAFLPVVEREYWHFLHINADALMSSTGFTTARRHSSSSLSTFIIDEKLEL